MDDTRLREIVAAAKTAGADDAEAVFGARASLSVTVRLGRLEEVEREEARDLGVRVFIGRRQASVAGSDLSKTGVAKLVERCVAMARLAPEDPYCGLAPHERLFRGTPPDLDLYDAAEPDAQTLEDQARAAEDSARTIAGVTNSEGASASWSSSSWRLATSAGFAGEHRAAASSLSAQVIAGDGDAMELGYEGRTTRWREDLPAPQEIGAEAGRRAVAALGARKLSSTNAAVIFENRIAASVLAPLIGAISGPAVARGISFLKDKLGAPVFSSDVTVSEDPHVRRGLGSAPFDDEGAANQARSIIDGGVLTTWLLNASSARQLGLETTGHASRAMAGPPGVSPTNLTLEPGEADLAGLVRRAGRGVLVTSMFGPSLNANTGDWSVGCSGSWFENGEIAYPVNEITVAGNLIELYARLVPGADLEVRRAANAPSILIEGVAIAGS